MARNRNQARKANNADMYAAFYLSPEEAADQDRNGLLAIQTFEHTLEGLDGLNGLDEDNDFEDGQTFTIPITIRINKRKAERVRDTAKSRSIADLTGVPADGPSDDDSIPF
jgi:hypothetical protein